MDREALLERLKLLTQVRDDLAIRYHRFAGAVEECQYWLSVIDQAAESSAPDGPSEVSGVCD